MSTSRNREVAKMFMGGEEGEGGMLIELDSGNITNRNSEITWHDGCDIAWLCKCLLKRESVHSDS